MIWSNNDKFCFLGRALKMSTPLQNILRNKILCFIVRKFPFYLHINNQQKKIKRKEEEEDEKGQGELKK
jgi:hypothetical protein